MYFNASNQQFFKAHLIRHLKLQLKKKTKGGKHTIPRGVGNTILKVGDYLRGELSFFKHIFIYKTFCLQGIPDVENAGPTA